ncbi:MAG TPA: glycosyltransferase [Kofleriaceae bacterium]|nr:glycosyltransferase [Kofleriaceae bacterium]
MRISVVAETWNLGDPAAAAAGLPKLLATLAPQLDAAHAELVVTHAGIDADARARIAAAHGRAIRWIELPADANYYEHKNQGFAATTGEIVAFVDGDCDPSPRWLAALTGPIAAGEASVAVGATSYPGPLARLANELDFPYFDEARRRCAIEDAPPTVRNFFANNVAFARAVFAAHPYPAIDDMFHGQCQVLGLTLLQAGYTFRFAPEARVVHAWPDGFAEWLSVRLLRGADTVSLLPFVLAAYAPRAVPATRALGPLPALAILGLRALTGSWAALRRGPVVRGLGLVACVTVLDALGAAAARTVHRRIG